jgi:hypothetical protein
MSKSDSSKDKGDKEENCDGEIAEKRHMVTREQRRHDERDQECQLKGMRISRKKILGENKHGQQNKE